MKKQTDVVGKGHIAVDFDGTLVTYDGWKGGSHIGAPIVQTLKLWENHMRTFRIGQLIIFGRNPGVFLLSQIDTNKVSLVNLSTGSLFARPVEVNHVESITGEEFDRISCGCDFRIYRRSTPRHVDTPRVKSPTYEVGNLYLMRGQHYILAGNQAVGFVLISLLLGNRFSKPTRTTQRLPKSFIEVEKPDKYGVIL